MENNFVSISDYKLLPKIKGVYIIKNIVNNKIYIGSTFSSKGVCNRIKEHLRKLKANTHVNQYLQNSFNKYLEHNFYVSILEDCTNRTNQYIREKDNVSNYKFFR